MHWQTKIKGAAMGMAVTLLAWSSSSHAQVFDTPPSDFTLEALPSSPQFPFPSLPITLNIGNFDTSIVASGNRTLNEVAIASISQFSEDNESLIHRFWTIVHNSASDTRSLIQTTPSDIEVFSEFDPFYLIPDSLNLLDLNGDSVDDIALLGAVLDLDADSVAGIKLQKSGATGPVGVFGVPSQAGPEFFATNINLLGQQTDSSIPSLFNGNPSQPSLTQADFDGDGLIDLAFYDFEAPLPAGTGVQIAVTLANNGTFGTLPRTDTELVLPADLQGFDYAYNLVAADIDGDGAPDLAITFDVEEFSGVEDQLLVFKGNGDGSFVPEPIASALLGEDASLAGLAVGNFDGNDFLDFAVVSIAEQQAMGLEGSAALNVVFCSPGDATCDVDVNAFGNFVIPFSLAAADFNEDGLDDLAAAFLACDTDTDQCDDPSLITSGVAILLNNDGDIDVNPDQVLPLGGSESNRFTLQVAAKDIDGCGGPDLAYIGFDITAPTPDPSATPIIVPAPIAVGIGAQGLSGTNIGLASVAFNHNDDPIADAGQPVQTEGGVRVGGDPTCSGEPGEVLSIQWTVVSGSADISDPTAANPIVDANTSTVLQVTCTDACGASSSSTVTVTGGFLLNGTGCSLGQGAASGMAWIFGLIGLLPLAIRRIRG